MLKAVIRLGEVRLLEPLPVDWQDGQELVVEKVDADDSSPEQIRADFALLEQMCSENTPEEEEELERALQEADRIAKEQVRREMGLPG
jgi:hypothetical protein